MIINNTSISGKLQSTIISSMQPIIYSSIKSSMLGNFNSSVDNYDEQQRINSDIVCDFFICEEDNFKGSICK